MRTDQDIAVDSMDRLHSTRGLDAQDIAVKVIDGVVLLVGIARSDLERAQAEQIVKQVRGVQGLTNCLTVCPRTASVPADPDITREAVATIRHQFPEQVDALQVLVKNGRVALEGELRWNYQRDVIEAMVRSVRGVTLVVNRIRIGERPLTNAMQDPGGHSHEAR
jgi:osmotically-inducible protein OsmY